RYDQIVELAGSNADGDRRELAVSALGFSKRPETVAHLVPRLDDPAPQVRGSAAAAIGILNPPNPPIEKMAALLSDPDKYVRMAALFGLKLLVRENPDPALVERVATLAREEADPDVRNEAVLLLGRMKGSKALDVLVKKGLEDEVALIRLNAAIQLGQFGTDGWPAVPALIKRLKDGETSVVEAAHWALMKITGRVEADRQYNSWFDWYNEQAQVVEFVCPRCGDTASSAGDCPKCAVPREARVLGPPEYVCPAQDDGVYPKPGKCPKCQKDLVPRKKETPKKEPPK
ncbi:MAG TPA: HEAT repeat domain-containing protein, partial [Planctomycetota bacterium]|nr:HEAT repeat domain-containing protein [Planctomycetota bacterium]